MAVTRRGGVEDAAGSGETVDTQGERANRRR